MDKPLNPAEIEFIRAAIEQVVIAVAFFVIGYWVAVSLAERRRRP